MNFQEKKDQALSEIDKFCKLDSAKIKAIEEFVWLLLQENNNFNFIGKSTIDEIWNRHVLDSAQILKFIANKNLKFADFGSGAGFPGIIMSILGIREVHLIEKAFRKADFLRRAKLISPNKIFVHQSKLEELNNIQFDCITSRALANLEKLLEYSTKFLKKDGYCLFLKGKNLPEEIIEAKKKFNFEYEVFPSLTSVESGIILVKAIKSL